MSLPFLSTILVKCIDLNLTPMIDIRNAANSAVIYIQGIQDLLQTSLDNLRLEEAEISEDSDFWLITLGYDKPERKSTSSLGGMNLDFSRYPSREYKLFKINADSGEVAAMKIREL